MHIYIYIYTGVIWVDAHADINTPDVSESGNTHGMPVAFLMRLIDPRKYPGWEWMASTPVLRPQQLVYIGLRDVDAGLSLSLSLSPSCLLVCSLLWGGYD